MFRPIAFAALTVASLTIGAKSCSVDAPILHRVITPIHSVVQLPAVALPDLKPCLTAKKKTATHDEAKKKTHKKKTWGRAHHHRKKHHAPSHRRHHRHHRTTHLHAHNHHGGHHHPHPKKKTPLHLTGPPGCR